MSINEYILYLVYKIDLTYRHYNMRTCCYSLIRISLDLLCDLSDNALSGQRKDEVNRFSFKRNSRQSRYQFCSIDPLSTEGYRKPSFEKA